ncbi:MAG: carbamoyl-phosphate synthase (glutamine-hydrolyzing) large subunit [Candidatus Levybacteria bacterium]|nr:carbamoyl-phosphate synthase (glutamine-hydrolyzing) large subunit [Candidatus Levybacteria bacterium]
MKQFRKVIVLGSGALKIGEAGEFDYSGSQAIKALNEEKVSVVLVNPNIATIQTSKFLADKIYFLPVNEHFVTEIIKKEQPDGILLSFGGQTALNCGLELHRKGILKKYGVQVLGTPISAIQLSEDRQKFANHLKQIDVAVQPSHAATNVKKAQKIAKETGYPVMIRSGYALGGQGSGIAYNEKELIKIAEQAFAFAPQILVEKYLHHYKEVEYEVVRDKYDNCVTVCNMENMDPLGIHTGESVVIAPSQTLTNFEYHTLRSIAIKIVRSLKIVGECNVQFALNPNPKNMKTDNRGNMLDYYVIELNARLSRSSALASKATGYPLAYVAAKLALGRNLTTLQNKVTKVTQFCFEPALDYVTVKIPRWDINKFRRADETIGSSMKSVGEVMGIGRTFEEAYQKAIRMLDLEFEGTINEKTLTKKEDTKMLLKNPTPYRIFALGKAFYEGMPVQEVSRLTGIDPWFLHRIKHIVEEEKELSKTKTITKETLLRLKQVGCSDKRIGMLIGKTGLEIRDLRKKYHITPSVFQIDTLAGEFPAKTNYLYMTYHGNHHDVSPTKKKGVVVLGSGPYRIGSSVEFDWTTVNTSLSLKKHGKQSIMINCNPETVSTDYDISDRLYFEELTFERIADIYDFEDPYGAIISVGGQTPNNRAKSLQTYGCNILGTHPDDIDRAEDRNKFSALLDKLAINQPAWNSFSSLQDAEKFCNRVGYPVLIRPSYVLSGSNMKVCHNKQELEIFVQKASIISSDYPVVVSKFIEHAKEIEVDCVAAKGILKAIVISEHIEDAGVHSGDATIVLPPQKIYTETEGKLHKIATLLAEALHITGPFNMQCLAKNNRVMVIETNLRSSRTFPFISKVTGVDMMQLATDAFFHAELTDIDTGMRNKKFIAVKAAQFSFGRLTGADPILDVEMASTGEVACFGEDIEEAFLKAELSVGGVIPEKAVFVTIGGDENKVTFLKSAEQLHKQGIKIYATEHTTQYLLKNNIPATKLYKIHEHKSPNILEYFQKKKVDLAISIADPQSTLDVHDDYIMRRAAVDHNIPLYTDLKKSALLVSAISHKKLSDLLIKSWDEYLG